MTTFSICFETDKTIRSKDALYTYTEIEPIGACASGGNILNKDAFTISNILNLKTRIISNKLISQHQDYYNTHFSNIKLWIYDMNIKFDIDIDIDITKIVCIILFINDVYGIHYVVNTDNYTIKQQKQYILENVIPKYKLYSQKDNDDYVLLINTFDSNGLTNTSTYETIF